MTLSPQVWRQTVEFLLEPDGTLTLSQTTVTTPRNRRGLVHDNAVEVTQTIVFPVGEVREAIGMLVEMYAIAVRDGSTPNPGELYSP